MKKIYIRPSVETVKLQLQQIIATSELVPLEDSTPANEEAGMDFQRRFHQCWMPSVEHSKQTSGNHSPHNTNESLCDVHRLSFSFFILLCQLPLTTNP